MSIKNFVKFNPALYRLMYYTRNKLSNWKIQREQEVFNVRARQENIPLEDDTQVTFEIVRERLRARGIIWPPMPKGRPLHILYASLPGNWEAHNIPPEIQKVARLTTFYIKDQEIDIDKGWEHVRTRVDETLPAFIKEIHAKDPIDLVLSYLSGAQISEKTIRAIGNFGIAMFAFHLDDRLFFYGRKHGNQWSGPAAVCRAYDLNLTNSPASLIKYRCEGANAIFWPEGANPDFYRPIDTPKKYEVSFCGHRYGRRPLLVEYLRKAGISVACFGKDWEHGYQSEYALVEVYNASVINLGIGYVCDSDDQCLKGRDFEIPGCGTVYLTSHNSDLAKVFDIGSEILTYRNYADCAAIIKSTLSDDALCASLRKRSRLSVVNRHSWAARIMQIVNFTSAEPFTTSNAGNACFDP